MTTSHILGHKIYFNFKLNEWIFSDNDEMVKSSNRSCIRCKKRPTAEGYDACLGHIKGVSSACCGHGVCNPILVTNKENENEKLKSNKKRFI